MLSKTFPRMVEVKQKLPSFKITNYISAIRSQLREKNLYEKVKKGSKIAITVGSRNIAHYPEILATVVEEVKRAGGEPFLFPAMGSHGGATSKGQLKLLESLGITPHTVGAPIFSSMEVVEVGRLDNGAPVYIDNFALKADGIIVVNRVKPHTDFKDRIESGLMKMMVIGMGKQKGAETIHWYRSEGYHKLIPSAARLVMEKLPIILGLAIVENPYHEIAIVKALEPNEIEKEEAKLLEKAKRLTAKLPFKQIDVLIVEEIGKDISGAGMDPNVTGRFWLPGETKRARCPRIKRIVVLDLTEATHGNATGIGMADVTTKRAVSKIDYDITLVNCLTDGSLEECKIPAILPNDRDAIAIALQTCGPIDPNKADVVRIKNTLELERFWISEGLAEKVKMEKQLSKKIAILSEPREMQFDVLGNLAR